MFHHRKTPANQGVGSHLWLSEFRSESTGIPGECKGNREEIGDSPSLDSDAVWSTLGVPPIYRPANTNESQTKVPPSKQLRPEEIRELDDELLAVSDQIIAPRQHTCACNVFQYQVLLILVIACIDGGPRIDSIRKQ